METNEEKQPASPSYEPKEPKSETSPFWPQNLVDLFFRPRRFFSSQLAIGNTPYVLLATWCYGIANAMDRMDVNILRAEMGHPRPGWDRIGPLLTESWLGYWFIIMLFGALGGLLLWYFGGWWYGVRVRWSGDKAPDKSTAEKGDYYEKN